MLIWQYLIWSLFPDSTLTLTMVTRLTQGVSMGNNFPTWLGIPWHVRRTIREQYSSMALYNIAVWEWYLRNHPAPSWRYVANSLYFDLQHTVLEGLKDQVPSLKGELPVLSQH